MSGIGLYFQCPTGAAGNMLLAALVDCGVPVSWLEQQLKTLPLQGWQLNWQEKKHHGLRSLHLEVDFPESQPHRHLHHIETMIRESELPAPVQDQSIAIFRRLAEAEARVHGTTIEKVHFHEVGAIDAIIDIVGCCLALSYLQPAFIGCSPLPLGSGMIECQHGLISVPAPATLELVKDIPVYQGEEQGELLTPTAAAILGYFVQEWGALPPGRPLAYGYGAGSKTLKQPNILRAILYQPLSELTTEDLWQLETNIDDQQPETLPDVLDKLLAAGANDAWYTPILMKKGRPAFTLGLLCPAESLGQVEQILAESTTSLGWRKWPVKRRALPRQIQEVETRWGMIRFKVSGQKAAPEYEDCKRIAEISGQSLLKVYQEAWAAYWRR
ncbi:MULTISPECIES: nickel pincer cofactor biosynthesis protein LarC [unclassified Carboxydocella]|uniref:nickel pincer cofactor biosynthesis protein LarC n=1 Tax=unclassified Carboxydocella TaxID=2685367 RepID=UPI0009AD647A|nr:MULTISPECIES: nickel pincer cofactor biosynthesis protein LarC [unclassified Carboxydocella]GAW28066.1 TIGR00299 family protein [Carboxydocella sp. ULO1]GAW32534.1 TIGR00299 family protein [Carboxydocella sp. JDF658]